jgi:hypothetical protein
MHKKTFTLLEVMVAAFILTLSLVMVLQILGTARARVLRAERRWARTHLLAQGLDFHLMAGPDETFPMEFLPKGFSIVCELSPAHDLPIYADQPIQGKMLSCIKVTVVGVNNEIVNSFKVQKIVNQE